MAVYIESETLRPSKGPETVYKYKLATLRGNTKLYYYILSLLRLTHNLLSCLHHPYLVVHCYVRHRVYVDNTLSRGMPETKLTNEPVTICIS